MGLDIKLLACLEHIRSYTWSFDHLVPDPCSVGPLEQANWNIGEGTVTWSPYGNFGFNKNNLLKGCVKEFGDCCDIVFDSYWDSFHCTG